MPARAIGPRGFRSPASILPSARKSSPMADIDQATPAPARISFALPRSALLERLFSRWLLVVAFFVTWEVAPRTGAVDRTFLPPFSEILADGARLVGNGQ